MPEPIAAASAAGGVSSHIAGGIAQVQFEHPKGNSLPAALLRALADEITGVGRNDDARVVLLRSGGAGPFCGGASFDEPRTIADETMGKEFFMGFARVILAMTRCPKPIVTRVQGKAVGGGLGIVAASDYVMAAETASVRLSELAVGIGPFVVGPAVERKVGRAEFAAMAIDADWRDAEWAERHGLYAKLFDSVNALDAALEMFVRNLAEANPEAVAQIKRMTWADTADWPRLLEERAATSGRLVLSHFTRDAIAAFKR